MKMQTSNWKSSRPSSKRDEAGFTAFFSSSMTFTCCVSAVRDRLQWIQLMFNSLLGDEVDVTVLRDGQRVKHKVTLAKPR